MANILVPEIPVPGFSFDLCYRNQLLAKKGFAIPKAVKTGTTIAGLIFKDGVILGADTRASEGSIIADKISEKIHYVSDNMYCCGAGTAADTGYTTDMISSKLELHRLNTNRVLPVITACTMLKQLLFRHQGHIGAALILGGVDNNGAHIHTIHPHGSTEYSKYTTMGSGSLAAMSVLESEWKPDIFEEEAKDLMCRAISAGVFNDLGSGNFIDLCVIRKGSVEYVRPYKKANLKGQKQGFYRFKKGTTAVLKTNVIPLEIEDSVEKRIIPESMDTSS